MKIKTETGELRGLRCSRFVAIINKSKKLGIPRRYQKTWSLKTVAPEFTLKQMMPGIEAEAKRWEAKVLAKIKLETKPPQTLPESPSSTASTPPTPPAA